MSKHTRMIARLLHWLLCCRRCGRPRGMSHFNTGCVQSR